MVSAIKIGGQRLYQLAREGKEVERAARPVTIHELEVLSFTGTSARLAVRCSKGTYIRSLVTDIGEAIGCGAHVVALRRTFVSPFENHPMISMDALEARAIAASSDLGGSSIEGLDSLLLAPDAGLTHLPAVKIDENGLVSFQCGQPAPCVSVAV
ncbi:unnamed protein product, partial [Cyprideis torosa]